MPLHISSAADLIELLRQCVATTAALLWQHVPDFVHSFEGHRYAVGAAMTGLAAGLAFSVILLASSAFSGPARQAIGGWRLGGSSGILLPQTELAFEIGDLLFGVEDLLLCFVDPLLFLGELLGLFVDALAKLVVQAAEALVFLSQCIPVGREGSRVGGLSVP